MSAWRRAPRAAAVVALAAACAGEGGDGSGGARVAEAQAAPDNRLTEEERAEGWRLLFDGRTLEGWRGYRMEEAPAGWAAIEGTLARVGPGADLITRERFGDFELSLEWRIAEGGNSGIMYRGDESEEYLYQTAPETQVLDDDRHPDGASPFTSAGAVYALYAAPRRVVRPAGEWNQVRIVARGPRVEHWLNGILTAEYEQGSEEWNRRVAATKFRQWPRFGTLREGHVGLQDHGDPVWYRNVKIRDLP